MFFKLEGFFLFLNHACSYFGKKEKVNQQTWNMSVLQGSFLIQLAGLGDPKENREGWKGESNFLLLLGHCELHVLMNTLSSGSGDPFLLA